MTGAELKEIRHGLGLSTLQLGRAFGYTGSDTTASVTIRKYESGGRPIPPWLGRLAIMFDEHGVPPEFLNTRRIELENIRTEIAAATSVATLCSLLNRFERLRKDMADDGIDADEIERPNLPDLETLDYVNYIDWSDWQDGSTPMASDKEHILFHEHDGRWIYREIEDCLPLDDEGAPVFPKID